MAQEIFDKVNAILAEIKQATPNSPEEVKRNLDN